MGRKQDYHNSIIYHIRHMESKEVVYVGSTTKFSQRKSTHKWLCNHEEGKDFTIPIYYHIRNNGGFDCFEVIPIKSLKLENKTQLLIAEQEEIDKHRNLVNRQKAHRTIEQKRIDNNEKCKKWRENNPEHEKQYQKKYHEEHKAELNEKTKKYRQEHKVELNENKKQYREDHKAELNERNKKWREEHKEGLKLYNKQYKEDNKEKIKEKLKQKIECEFCSKRLSKCSMRQHHTICKSRVPTTV